jgi:hypothetical protein
VNGARRRFPTSQRNEQPRLLNFTALVDWTVRKFNPNSKSDRPIRIVIGQRKYHLANILIIASVRLGSIEHCAVGRPIIYPFRDGVYLCAGKAVCGDKGTLVYTYFGHITFVHFRSHVPRCAIDHPHQGDRHRRAHKLTCRHVSTENNATYWCPH